jgi:spore coat assembly protein SafA
MAIYSVRTGDSMWSIAQRYQSSLASLERANPQIKNPNLIYSGQKLQIPGAVDSFEPGPSRSPSPSVSGTRGTTAPSSSSSGSSVVDKAKSYLGTPYNGPWDRSYKGYGTDPNGLGLRAANGNIDCSQLTSLAYGGKLPADAATQGDLGPRLDPSTAKAGDLIAFDEHGTGEASHVGIADGNGNVIHASSYYGKVVVTPISDIDSAQTWKVGL